MSEACQPSDLPSALIEQALRRTDERARATTRVVCAARFTAIVASVCLLMDHALALAAKAGGGVHWTLVGARAVYPRAQPDGAKLVYDDVYPGVALTVELRCQAVAYRFDVAPGGSADAIRMRYGGAEHVEIEADGRALRIYAGAASLREEGLRCFQYSGDARREVPCRYSVELGMDGVTTVTLDIGAYDRRLPLVLDPRIGWSSYLGGSSSDEGKGIAVDTSGNVYVAGDTYASDFPTSGGFDTSHGGDWDAYVTKVDASGSNVIWSTYLGGSEREYCNALTMDGSGDVYVTGVTYSSDFPLLGGFDTSLGGSQDAFVTKVDASGSALDWSSYLGGGSPDYGYGIAVDGDANVYVTGYTLSDDFPASGGFDTSSDGPDAFVTKVSATGSILAWSSFLGGSDRDFGNAVALDASGNVYVAGETTSSDFPSSGGFQTGFGGVDDAFVTKVSATGSSLAWSSYLGGSGSEEGRGVALDGSGSVYVTGTTESSDFPALGGFDTGLGGTEDVFVTKVNAAGSTLAWSSYVGGSASDQGNAISVDGNGNIYVAGSTYSTDFPVSQGFDTKLDGGGDAFAMKVDSAGPSVAWSSYLGGRGYDRGNTIALDGNGNVYVAGTTSSTDFPSSGGFDTNLGVDGNNDAFVTRLVVCDNGVCDPGENACTCPADCPSSCGDGCCAPAEDACACPADCPSSCGDGCCTGSEGACGCPVDCPGDCCGDGICDDDEDCRACAADCGSCAGPDPDVGVGDGPGSSGASGCSCDLAGRGGTGLGLMWLGLVLLHAGRRGLRSCRPTIPLRSTRTATPPVCGGLSNATP